MCGKKAKSDYCSSSHVMEVESNLVGESSSLLDVIQSLFPCTPSFDRGKEGWLGENNDKDNDNDNDNNIDTDNNNDNNNNKIIKVSNHVSWKKLILRRGHRLIQI